MDYFDSINDQMTRKLITKKGSKFRSGSLQAKRVKYDPSRYTMYRDITPEQLRQKLKEKLLGKHQDDDYDGKQVYH
jgi:hypothetical protein